MALAILAAGTSNLSNLAILALLSRFLESLSFLEPELKRKILLQTECHVGEIFISTHSSPPPATLTLPSCSFNLIFGMAGIEDPEPPASWAPLSLPGLPAGVPLLSLIFTFGVSPDSLPLSLSFSRSFSLSFDFFFSFLCFLSLKIYC